MASDKEDKKKKEKSLAEKKMLFFELTQHNILTQLILYKLHSS
jgi:hypothetical protein